MNVPFMLILIFIEPNTEGCRNYNGNSIQYPHYDYRKLLIFIRLFSQLVVLLSKVHYLFRMTNFCLILDKSVEFDLEQEDKFTPCTFIL